jgi:hypothetical protein
MSTQEEREEELKVLTTMFIYKKNSRKLSLCGVETIYPGEEKLHSWFRSFCAWGRFTTEYELKVSAAYTDHY